MEDLKEFKINDFYQACILKTVGFPLLSLEKTSGHFVKFVFSDPNNEAEKTLERYWNREIKVVGRDLIENINELKTRIHEKMKT